MKNKGCVQFFKVLSVNWKFPGKLRGGNIHLPWISLNTLPCRCSSLLCFMPCVEKLLVWFQSSLVYSSFNNTCWNIVCQGSSETSSQMATALCHPAARHSQAHRREFAHESLSLAGDISTHCRHRRFSHPCVWFPVREVVFFQVHSLEHCSSVLEAV